MEADTEADTPLPLPLPTTKNITMEVLFQVLTKKTSKRQGKSTKKRTRKRTGLTDTRFLICLALAGADSDFSRFAFQSIFPYRLQSPLVAIHG